MRSPSKPSTGNRVGRPNGTTAGKAAAYAAALLIVDGATVREASEATGITWSQARTVRNNLRQLAGVVGRLPESERARRKRPGPKPGEGGAPHGMRGDPELAHQAALALIDGASLNEAAERAGITFARARTVRRNLRVLAGFSAS